MGGRRTNMIMGLADDVYSITGSSSGHHSTERSLVLTLQAH